MWMLELWRLTRELCQQDPPGPAIRAIPTSLTLEVFSVWTHEEPRERMKRVVLFRAQGGELVT
jgi:hypothetical protein